MAETVAGIKQVSEVDHKVVDTPNTVKTTCPYCGVGCGVLATPQADGSIDIKGDPDHPANFGRLCSKGSALGETVDLEGRILEPKIGGKTASWDDAIDLVAEKFQATIAEHGPDSVAFYVSGQILTEDYYIANKLMKGVIGSANIDTNSRLCMASSVAGHKRAFGADTVPGTYEDLELADLIVLVGSNLAWCHPVIYQRIIAAKEQRPEMKIVVIDPRKTMTADVADLHLPIKADGDVPLFLGLLSHLAKNDALNQDYVDQYTNGFRDALDIADGTSLEQILDTTGVEQRDLDAFYDLFLKTEKVVTVYSQGVNQSSSGSDKVNSIINCHLATGRIGKEGMGPFSITGQPNAMGGREVGGLANMLACHMDIENSEHRDIVQNFWKSPTIADKPGLKAVQMFDAVHDGRIKAIWIMATNPVDSLPNADLVEEAIKNCPFVVVSDVIEHTDTARHADVLLPSEAWGEKQGMVTNSERRMSRQRRFIDAPGEAKADWWQFQQVAARMGHGDLFDYQSARDIFIEYAELSATQNDDARDFDIGALSDISDAQFESFPPTMWPAKQSQAKKGATSQSQTRFFANGNFYTPDRKARFVPVQMPQELGSEDGKLTLNTGRVRDHWHTMTRTAKSPRLSQHITEPYVEIHPDDATRLKIAQEDIVSVSSGFGEVLLRAVLTGRQQVGAVFAPLHWTDQYASSARVDRLVTANCDPISGQPALKSSRVGLKTKTFAKFGFAICQELPDHSKVPYWALAKCVGGWRIEFAINDDTSTEDLAALINAPKDIDPLSYQDAVAGQERYAWFKGDHLVGAIYLSTTPIAISRNWAIDQLAIDHSDYQKRFAVVAGRPAADQPDRGPIVCSCFSVGANEICAAAKDGALSVDAIGKTLNAGTNCGSCRSEIASLLEEAKNDYPAIAAE